MNILSTIAYKITHGPKIWLGNLDSFTDKFFECVLFSFVVGEARMMPDIDECLEYCRQIVDVLGNLCTTASNNCIAQLTLTTTSYETLFSHLVMNF